MSLTQGIRKGGESTRERVCNHAETHTFSKEKENSFLRATGLALKIFLTLITIGGLAGGDTME